MSRCCVPTLKHSVGRVSDSVPLAMHTHTHARARAPSTCDSTSSDILEPVRNAMLE
jgi:hypothetical protein